MTADGEEEKDEQGKVGAWAIISLASLSSVRSQPSHISA